MTRGRDRNSSSQTCPRCWTPYRPGAERCVRCGFELRREDSLSFIDLFGPPQVLRRYSIQDTLAESRVGHVYKALDRETQTLCVIKELSGAALLDPLEAERAGGRLRRLVRQLSQLDHPNLVRVHSLLSEGSRHFVVMDLVDGPNLQMVLDEREEPIPEPVTLQWGAKLCDALSHLHHQDPPVFFPALAASHILLSTASQPILIDLGLSQLFQSKHRRSEGVAGDVRALGAVLYHVLTSREAIPGRYRPLRQLNPDVSAPSAEAIHRAMSRSAEERFPSMAEFKQVLLARDPTPEESIAVIPESRPFKLVSGRQALTLKELVESVLAGGPEEWEAVLDRFLDGQVTTWLKELSTGLREAGQNRTADELTAAFQSAEQLRNRAAGATVVQQKAAFHNWLFATGYAWGQPELAVGTYHLRLGAVKGKLRMGAIFGIENKGSGYLVGEVRSRVDWLKVVEGEFACRGGQEAQITAELSDHSVLSQPASSARAIEISSNGGQAWIGASIAAPRPTLALATSVVDFGDVQPGERAHASAVIRNDGGGVLTGRVSSTVEWLSVASTDFRCAAGATSRVDVELRAQRLPLGLTDRDGALIVDSDFGQARIAVRATRVQPHLEVQPGGVDFGTIAPVCRVSRTVRVTNSGTGMLVGRVMSQLKWLELDQQEFACRPSESVLIAVWCDPTLLPGGLLQVPDALVIDSNGGYLILPVSLEVRRPRLHVDHRPLDFGIIMPGQEIALPLTVGNKGATSLQLEAIPRMPWLSVDPSRTSCAAGENADLTLTLLIPHSAESGSVQVDRALYLASDGGVANLDLKYEIVSPRLAVDPLHLDFGLIGPSEVARGQVELGNSGSGTLEWCLMTESTWLEVFPRQGACEPGETVTIELNGFALGLPDGTTSAQAVVLVESNGGQVELPISVAVSSPSLAVLPLLLDLGVSENFAPLEGVLRIANHGGGYLQGEISSSVQWLKPEPASFHCASGSIAEIRVLATPQDLSDGETVLNQALLVTSNVGQEVVDLRLEIVTSPVLQIAPEELVYEVESGGTERFVTRSFTVTNQGFGAPRVRYQPTVEWLDTDRGSSTLRHGRRVRVAVTLNVALWRESGRDGQLELRAGETTLACIPVLVAADDGDER